jgi:hypothetical protein
MEETPVNLTEEKLHPILKQLSKAEKSKPTKKDYIGKGELDSKYSKCGENAVLVY